MGRKRWRCVNAVLIIILSFAACERFGLPSTTLSVSEDKPNTRNTYIFEADDLDEPKFEDGGHIITKRDTAKQQDVPERKSNITTKVRKALKIITYILYNT